MNEIKICLTKEQLSDEKEASSYPSLNRYMKNVGWNNYTEYSLKDDERFKSADDVEETHVKTTDW